MLDACNSDRWRKARADYMDSARACRTALTIKGGYWEYAPSDARLKKAIGAWVRLARNAHDFAMGRRKNLI